jgi:hypothetical protein
MTEFERQVTSLFAEGHGAGAIALKLKAHTKDVFKVLKAYGLKRTRQEALDIRARNGLNGAPQKAKPYKASEIVTHSSVTWPTTAETNTETKKPTPSPKEPPPLMLLSATKQLELVIQYLNVLHRVYVETPEAKLSDVLIMSKDPASGIISMQFKKHTTAGAASGKHHVAGDEPVATGVKEAEPPKQVWPFVG